MKAMVYLSLLSLAFSVLGCASGGGGGKMSENFALEEFGAKATDPKMNDGNPSTSGMTGHYQAESRAKAAQDEADKYTEATITLPKAREINRVVIVGDQLERFDVEAHSNGSWKVIKEVKGNKKNKYAFSTELVADAVRVKVPRLYESREVGGQRRVRKVGSLQSGEGRVGEKKVYEIELYSKVLAETTSNTKATK